MHAICAMSTRAPAHVSSGPMPMPIQDKSLLSFFFGLPTQAFFKDVTDKATEFQQDGYLEFKAKWCAAEADHGGEHGDTTAEADCVGSVEVPDTVGQSHSVGWQMQKQGFRPSAIIVHVDATLAHDVWKIVSVSDDEAKLERTNAVTKVKEYHTITQVASLQTDWRVKNNLKYDYHELPDCVVDSSSWDNVLAMGQARLAIRLAHDAHVDCMNGVRIVDVPAKAVVTNRAFAKGELILVASSSRVTTDSKHSKDLYKLGVSAFGDTSVWLQPHFSNPDPAKDEGDKVEKWIVPFWKVPHAESEDSVYNMVPKTLDMIGNGEWLVPALTNIKPLAANTPLYTKFIPAPAAGAKAKSDAAAPPSATPLTLKRGGDQSAEDRKRRRRA